MGALAIDLLGGFFLLCLCGALIVVVALLLDVVLGFIIQLVRRWRERG